MSDAADVKACCAALYESDIARMLLGDTFHPGGLALTERLGQLLELKPGDRVLDVAAGPGESALSLARKFGCRVTGIDWSGDQTAGANGKAQAAGLSGSVRFVQGDAEQLRLADRSFDAVICECAFCTFPDKQAAAAEFARVLAPGGRVGLSDLTRSGPLPRELDGLLAWISCIADARPVAEYTAYLEGAGLTPIAVEPHDEALSQMVRDIQAKLLGAELMIKLKKIELPGVDLSEAKKLARAAADAVQRGLLGYSLVTARRSASC